MARELRNRLVRSFDFAYALCFSSGARYPRGTTEDYRELAVFHAEPGGIRFRRYLVNPLAVRSTRRPPNSRGANESVRHEWMKNVLVKHLQMLGHTDAVDEAHEFGGRVDAFSESAKIAVEVGDLSPRRIIDIAKAGYTGILVPFCPANSAAFNGETDVLFARTFAPNPIVHCDVHEYAPVPRS